MSSYVIKPILYGLCAGIIFSVLLGIHSKRTATEITHSFFGMTSSEVIQYFLIFITVFILVIASALSVLIQDLKYPRENPIEFTIETLLVTFIPALIVIIVVYFRKKHLNYITLVEYLVIAAKFGVVHILSQFSGIYSSLFGI